MKRMPLGLVTAVSVTGLLLAACGSSGGSGAGGSGAAAAPFRLMVDVGITPSAALGGLAFPGGSYGVQAAADAINAAGGIDGHQIKIDVCDNKSDPNQSARCGRQAVSNHDIAVVGSFDSFGAASLLPVLNAAKIPYIGGLPSSPQELTSPVSFQFDPGSNLSQFATAQLWIDVGCKRVVEITSPVPGTDEAVAGQQATLSGSGVTLDTESLALDAANIQPVLTSALARTPDCVTIQGPGPVDVKAFLGLRKLGYTGKFITAVGSLTSNFLPTLGKAGDGIIAINATLAPDSKDPLVQQYRKELLAYFKGDQAKAAANATEFSQTGWSSVQVVKQALTKAGGDPSAATLLRTLPTMCDIDVGNVYPHVNFCAPVKSSKTFPRVFNDQWQYFVVKNNAYVPMDNVWHDLRNTIPS